ncbi:hypothetical protein GSbR_09980 [Geobacter sp. SVR]|nr:hypothetical protein GSVR_13210 [Geobacter sp. SVR]GCF84398.1 hypothetical protein GSbR_09980 [Geobacter sp. SVR]
MANLLWDSILDRPVPDGKGKRTGRKRLAYQQEREPKLPCLYIIFSISSADMSKLA